MDCYLRQLKYVTYIKRNSGYSLFEYLRLNCLLPYLWGYSTHLLRFFSAHTRTTKITERTANENVANVRVTALSTPANIYFSHVFRFICPAALQACSQEF